MISLRTHQSTRYICSPHVGPWSADDAGWQSPKLSNQWVACLSPHSFLDWWHVVLPPIVRAFRSVMSHTRRSSLHCVQEIETVKSSLNSADIRHGSGVSNNKSSEWRFGLRVTVTPLYSLPVAEPSLLVSVFSLEEKGKGRENSVPWSGGQPAIMQRRSRPHLRINGHRARQLQC